MSKVIPLELPPPMSVRSRWAEAAAPGLESVRKLWKPFLLLQLAGLLLVGGYFMSPAIRDACDALGRVKARGGLPFSAVAMAISCGVVPELFKFVAGVDRRLTRRRLNDLAFHAFLFGAGGVVVDTFYMAINAALAGWEGWRAVAVKMLVDQFLYTPIIAIPLIGGLFTWRDCGFSVRRLWATVGPDWYLRRGLPLLLTSWAYWIPMSLLMYSLPPSLTFCFSAVANAASATLLTAVATTARPGEDVVEAVI